MKLSINTGSQLLNLSHFPQAIFNTLIAQMYDFNFKDDDEEDEDEVYFKLKR